MITVGVAAVVEVGVVVEEGVMEVEEDAEEVVVEEGVVGVDEADPIIT